MAEFDAPYETQQTNQTTPQTSQDYSEFAKCKMPSGFGACKDSKQDTAPASKSGSGAKGPLDQENEESSETPSATKGTSDPSTTAGLSLKSQSKEPYYDEDYSKSTSKLAKQAPDLGNQYLQDHDGDNQPRERLNFGVAAVRSNDPLPERDSPEGDVIGVNPTASYSYKNSSGRFQADATLSVGNKGTTEFGASYETDRGKAEIYASHEKGYGTTVTGSGCMYPDQDTDICGKVSVDPNGAKTYNLTYEKRF